MAVYKRTYRGYSGAITPAWSRFLILYRYSRRSLFRSKFMTGFYLFCFFVPLLVPSWHLRQRPPHRHLAWLAVRRLEILQNGWSFFLTFLNVQSVFAFILDRIHWSWPIFRPTSPMARLPSIFAAHFARRIRPRQAFRPRHHSFLDHLGSRSYLVLCASQSLRLGLVHQQSVDRQRHLPRLLDLDSFYLPARARSFRVGQVARCCGRLVTRGPLRRCWFRCRHQWRPANSTGLLAQHLTASSTSSGKICCMIPATAHCPSRRRGSASSPSPPFVSTCS